MQMCFSLVNITLTVLLYPIYEHSALQNVLQPLLQIETGLRLKLKHPEKLQFAPFIQVYHSSLFQKLQ